MSWSTAIAIVAGGVFSLAGVALGWVGTLSSEKRRDQRAEAREDSNRARARADQKEQFELVHLESCRVVLDRCGGLASNILDAYKDHQPRPDKETLRAARDELHREGLLLLDPDVRAKVSVAGQIFDDLFFPPDGHAAPNLAPPGADAWRDAIRSVSERLRHIYEGM